MFFNSVVVPERTFYLQAPSADIMKDWVSLLQWKMVSAIIKLCFFYVLFFPVEGTCH